MFKTELTGLSNEPAYIEMANQSEAKIEIAPKIMKLTYKKPGQRISEKHLHKIQKHLARSLVGTVSGSLSDITGCYNIYQYKFFNIVANIKLGLQRYTALCPPMVLTLFQYLTLMSKT